MIERVKELVDNMEFREIEQSHGTIITGGVLVLADAVYHQDCNKTKDQLKDDVRDMVKEHLYGEIVAELTKAHRDLLHGHSPQYVADNIATLLEELK